LLLRGLFLVLAFVTEPVFFLLQLFDSDTSRMSYVRAAIAAENVSTILADHAVLIPFSRFFGATSALVLALTSLDLVFTHLLINFFSLDLLVFLRFLLLIVD
jgi:hypothetical protein